MGTDVFLLTKPAGSNSIQRACSKATSSAFFYHKLTGADPGGGKRGLSHGQIFEIVIFSITWSYYINASQTF